MASTLRTALAMDNYEFCTQWVVERCQASAQPLRVLDYGCGSGKIVSKLLVKNVAAYGCDVFYEGGDYSDSVPKELFGTSVLRMSPDGQIPFGDNSFDLVISNISKAKIKSIPPKHFHINYKTLQILIIEDIKYTSSLTCHPF